MRTIVGPLTRTDNLATAARLLAGRVSDSLTIVDSLGSMKVLGALTRRDLILAYGRQMDQLRETEQDETFVEASEPF
jgi:CBS domain-containing protein